MYYCVKSLMCLYLDIVKYTNINYLNVQNWTENNKTHTQLKG